MSSRLLLCGQHASVALNKLLAVWSPNVELFIQGVSLIHKILFVQEIKWPRPWLRPDFMAA